jgi:hypothetical protein
MPLNYAHFWAVFFYPIFMTFVENENKKLVYVCNCVTFVVHKTIKNNIMKISISITGQAQSVAELKSVITGYSLSKELPHGGVAYYYANITAAKQALKDAYEQLIAEEDEHCPVSGPQLGLTTLAYDAAKAVINI